MNEELVAYCGVDCPVCSDYKDNKCPGCRKTEWQKGDICLPVECCGKRGIYFCGECPVFPCAEMKEFYKESKSHERAFGLMKSMRQDIKARIARRKPHIAEGEDV